MTIRTPDDEITTPGYFYPPFRPGLTFQGITYAGHSDYAVDWNRRNVLPGGGVEWAADDGEPVLAPARGTVVEVDATVGYVLIQHYNREYRTEYRHMDPVEVIAGQRVQRSQRIGRIGDKGNAPNGTHLHMRAYRRTKAGYVPIPLAFYGQPLPVSVRSDDKTDRWDPPEPVYVDGPPRRTTWEKAYKAAQRALTACEARCPVEPPETPEVPA